MCKPLDFPLYGDLLVSFIILGIGAIGGGVLCATGRWLAGITLFACACLLLISGIFWREGWL